MKVLQEKYELIKVDRFEEISSYHDIRMQLDRLGADFRNYLTKPEYLTPFLQPGRMVKVRKILMPCYASTSYNLILKCKFACVCVDKQVKNENDSFDWGIIVNFKKKNPRNPKEQTVVIVDVLLHISKDSMGQKFPKPYKEGSEGEVEVVPVVHHLISQISSLRLYYPKDLRPPDNRRSVLKTIDEVKKRFPDGPPLLNPITDMHIEDSSFKNIVSKIEMLEAKLFAHPLHKVINQFLIDNYFPIKIELLNYFFFLSL